MLDRDVVRRRVTKRILRQTRAISAHVRAAQVQNPYLESLDAPNLSFDIGGGGHAFSQVYSDVFRSAIFGSQLLRGERGQYHPRQGGSKPQQFG
jgi:hypothetical protein